jgi:hypothetical protein
VDWSHLLYYNKLSILLGLILRFPSDIINVFTEYLCGSWVCGGGVGEGGGVSERVSHSTTKKSSILSSVHISEKSKSLAVPTNNSKSCVVTRYFIIATD